MPPNNRDLLPLNALVFGLRESSRGKVRAFESSRARQQIVCRGGAVCLFGNYCGGSIETIFAVNVAL
jgi:hypothetical protein